MKTEKVKLFLKLKLFPCCLKLTRELILISSASDTTSMIFILELFIRSINMVQKCVNKVLNITRCNLSWATIHEALVESSIVVLFPALTCCLCAGQPGAWVCVSCTR